MPQLDRSERPTSSSIVGHGNKSGRSPRKIWWRIARRRAPFGVFLQIRPLPFCMTAVDTATRRRETTQLTSAHLHGKRIRTSQPQQLLLVRSKRDRSFWCVVFLLAAAALHAPLPWPSLSDVHLAHDPPGNVCDQPSLVERPLAWGKAMLLPVDHLLQQLGTKCCPGHAGLRQVVQQTRTFDVRS